MGLRPSGTQPTTSRPPHPLITLIATRAAGAHAAIPFVVEAWVKTCPGFTSSILVCVNCTPITGDVRANRDRRDIDLFGCGLHHNVAKASKDVQFEIWVNITTPYMPITSDGNAPDLEPFLNGIAKAVSKAMRVAYRPGSTDRVTQKDVVLDNLDEAIAEVSGDGKYRFNLRQLLYKLRPIVQDELGEELSTSNFSQIITDYESEHGEIPRMYREPRGLYRHAGRSQSSTIRSPSVQSKARLRSQARIRYFRAPSKAM